ncbi:hypothetical protein C8A00DRAFT_11245 [Chaetomidium leptoderma]|uniref:Serine-rich protein n=1 Tax=Chaetomidium leptoderma TaxID=669021 RepID=A0AAN7A2H0_9PEZI|nr:hypothetical protein C8A00DRAFT_11245 [Chaetomidium leptoderma]
MSAPPARHGRTTPIQDRSNSQSNKPGIRLVPYSPPRLDPEDRVPSQASSRENAGSRCSANYNDPPSSNAGHPRRPSWRDEVTEGDADGQGSALSSPTAPSFSLASPRDERGVSGVKPMASPSGVGPAGPTAPRLRSPSEVSANITDPHASERRRTRADSSPSPSTTTGRPRSLSRRANLRLTVHANGTFSLVPEEPESGVSESVTDSLTSPHPSRTPSAQDRPSTDTWSRRRASTPLTGASTVILDQSFSELPRSTPSSRGSSSTSLAEDPIAASPWNYRLVGGLRKVPTTPESKGKQPLYSTSASTSETQLAPLPETSAPIDDDDEDTPTREVVPKASFASVASIQTTETVSEATNYKVYGPESVAQESSDSLVFNSKSPSNWEVLGQSSPAPTFANSPPTTSQGGHENYVLYGAPSASPSSSLVTVAKKPRPVYSQESLVVAPLRPTKRKSYERFGYYKQRSRETLRSRTGSVQSLKSLSSIITSQDPTPAFLTAPVVLNLGSSSTQRFPWSVPQKSGSSSSNPPAVITLRPPAPMLQSQPHQWSSQLSTVMSESDGSDLARSVSPLSDPGAHHRRRSSTGWVSSMHSRQMASMSSSLAGQLDEAAATSGSESLERPQPSHAKAGPSQIRMVRDQDEHGDGLADLDHRPSKTGLSALFANGSSWNLQSGNSSRSNSFTSSIPAWARVYYGSGERRFLGRRPSLVTISDGGDSRPPSSGFYGSESPNTDNFPPAIFSPRRRAREVQPGMNQQPSPDHGSMDISPAPQGQDYRVFRTLKQKTSSIWSPHLQTDRRATRYSVWDPPSVNWSADSGIMGKRNAQVVLFILGFILPFAWMVAAFLPLPPNPKPHMFEVDNGKSLYSSTHPAFRYQQYVVDESRYESARWWRNLNRVMSIVGLLIIGAVVALAVIGVRQGWGVN